ncbi:MAG TPA: putative molybdenum carrier protein [Draconibacterium sp.]|nr:putative molybdenum carrier protein [Draconibacterium sp.]
MNSQIPCQKIISGGQTGVDRGTLDACLDLNFQCGGSCPKNRRAEDGTIPEKYPLNELSVSDYDYRTRQNVIDSDGTIIISGIPLKGGTLLTLNLAKDLNKPALHISSSISLDIIMDWMIKNNIRTLNVAGPRQSEWEEGYFQSYQLISQLIKQIRNLTHSL